MDYTAAMRLLIARSPSTSADAARTIRRLAMRSPVAEQLAERAIGAGLADPEANFTQAERDDLAALLTGEVTGRVLDIRLRVTPEEKRHVQHLASEAGQTLSDYIRRRIGLL